MAEAPKKPARPLAIMGAIAGAVGGWALAQYAGVALWVPFFITLVMFIIGSKTPLRPAHFRAAICLTAAQMIPPMISAVRSGWEPMIVDIVVMFIGIIWLWLRPGIAAALFLGIVQLASLVSNNLALMSYDFGTMGHRAHTVHCIWRVLALIFLVTGFMKWRRDSMASTQPPPPLPEET